MSNIPAIMLAEPLLVLRCSAIVPQCAAEQQLASIIYDELTNLSAGRGLHLGGSAINSDDGREVVAVGGVLDLISLARRMLNAVPKILIPPVRRLP